MSSWLNVSNSRIGANLRPPRSAPGIETQDDLAMKRA